MRITEQRRAKIEEFRLRNRLSRREMAARLGISRSSMNRVLNGEASSVSDVTAEILAPILGEDVHELPEVQPPPKKPMIAVMYTGQAMKPYMEPGVKYMAIQEELEFIEDGELVVAEIMHEIGDGKRADQVFVGIVSRRGDLVSIDRPKAEPIVARVAAIHWIARIVRPVSEVVVDGP